MTAPESATRLQLLSAGAAQGIVGSVADEFRAETGAIVEGTFGAVGAMRDRLLEGAACDAVILTATLIDTLEGAGHVVPATAAPLGRVRTGIAVRTGERLPPIADGAGLRKTLVEAAALYFPDPELATAGIHFVKVLRELGIHDAVVPRLRPFPNGATAMIELARSTGPGCVGCTQITEIRNTPGVVLVGPLPAGFELSTVYSIAVSAKARDPDLARRFVSILSGSASRALRQSAGFE